MYAEPVTFGERAGLHLEINIGQTERCTKPVVETVRKGFL